MKGGVSVSDESKRIESQGAGNAPETRRKFLEKTVGSVAAVGGLVLVGGTPAIQINNCNCAKSNNCISMTNGNLCTTGTNDCIGQEAYNVCWAINDCETSNSCTSPGATNMCYVFNLCSGKNQCTINACSGQYSMNQCTGLDGPPTAA
jgi:hypothetical protein